MAIINFYHGQQGGTPDPRNPKKITGHDIIRDNSGVITVYDGTVDTETGEIVKLSMALELSELTWQARSAGEKHTLYSANLPYSYLPTNFLEKLANEWAAEYYPYQGNQTAQRLIPNVDRYFGMFSFQTSAAESTTIYIITYLGMSPKKLMLYYPSTPETITLTPAELKRFLQSIGYKVGSNNGKMLLNSLMEQAQGRDLSQSRGDVEPTRTAISLCPIKPNLDIMEENVDG